MELETKLEKVARLIQEMQINPYTNEYLGEELGDKDYLEHIDEDKIEQQKNDPFAQMDKGPMKPGGHGSFSVIDSQTGRPTKVTPD